MTMSKRIVNGLLALLLALSLTPALAADVDINTADADALAQLDGVGPKKAQAIVDYRRHHGSFASADDLAQVPGIGLATVERNRGSIVIGR